MKSKFYINTKSLKYIIIRIAFIVSLCIFIFALFMISKKLYGYYYDNKQYEQLRAQVSTSHTAEKHGKEINNHSQPVENNKIQETALPYIVEEGNPEDLGKNGILADYSELKRQSSDIVGWLRIPGFKVPIDYPVMQSGDNEFYLYKDFYKNFSYAGSIFMDFRNNNMQIDRHTILYGHSMSDRAMLGNLKEFPKRPQDYKKITRIYFDMMNTRLEFEIFSICFEDAGYNYRQTTFSSDDEYTAFLERIRSKSVYDYNVKLTALDKILTLSTCNNTLGKEVRSVTHARLVKQIVYDQKSSLPSKDVISENNQKEIVSANSYLSKLSLQYLQKSKPKEAVFTPAFSTSSTALFLRYAAQLPAEAEAVTLNYMTADPKASVHVTLNGTKAEPSLLKLNYGENIITVKVVSRDNKFSRTYTIKATRLSEKEPDNER